MRRHSPLAFIIDPMAAKGVRGGLYRSRRVAGKRRFALATSKNDSNLRVPRRQGSSVAEQGTHKPLVGSSNLPPGTDRHAGANAA